MRILVFEWLVGGGVAGEEALPPNDPFLVQGAGMYGAILEDCLKLGAQVHSPLDPQYTQAIRNFEHLRCNDNFHVIPIESRQDVPPTLQSLAKESEHIVLIAPECEGILTRCVQWLDGFQSKLVCGPQNLIEIFADKNQTQQLLRSKGISVPLGIPLPAEILAGGDGRTIGKLIAATDLSWPLVLKPCDGAGGDDVLLCHNLEQLEAAAKQPSSNQALRAERYIAGMSVSISIVRNQHETRLLPATEQRFSSTWNRQRPGNDLKNAQAEAIGHFVKSAYQLPEGLQRRAAALASTVADAFPAWHGYLGVDMILANDGADVVVELNPRLTASYETIRVETGFNLMEFLLARISKP